MNFAVEDVSGFEILSSAPADSHATRISCQGLVGFSFRNISHMAMRGLAIDSCGSGAVGLDMEVYSNPYSNTTTVTYGVSFESVLDTSISNCSFQDSAGTALGVLDSSLDMRGSNHFTGNCRRCGNYTCLCYGGGIYTSMSTLMFTGNTTFRANSALYGGGIYAQNSYLNFRGNSNFASNTAASSGGGIYVLNSTLNFIGSSTFGKNAAVNYGGGIGAPYTTLVTISGDSIFENNSAVYGGGIYGQNSALTLSGSSIFGNNSAAYFGGGIFVEYTAMTFNGGSIFLKNSAQHGGGMHALSSALNFSGRCTFGNNLAAGSGGGVSSVVYTLMSFNGESIFRNNSAEYGGGIYASYSTRINYNGTIVFRNNSAAYGGGIYPAFNSVLSFNGNSTFRNNYAAVTGGGIFTFQHNTLSFNGNTNFTHNSAVAGGGMSVLNSIVNFTCNCIFTHNSADGYAGGIYLISSTLNFSGITTFENNSAGIGGGIYTIGSTLTITGNRSDNIGERHGGSRLSGSSFMKNSAMIHGGAVYGEDSVLSFQGHNNFRGNSAQFYAGGVYSKNSTLRFSGSTSFKSNSGQLGGGIYGLGTSLYFTGNGSFTANTATRGGAEYLVNSFNFLSQSASVTMDGNNATEFGGGVYVEDSDPISYCFPESLNLQRCIFQADGLFQISINDINALLPNFYDPVSSNEPLQLNESTAHAIRAFLNVSVHFCNNYAQRAGSAVYGGSVDNCLVHLGFNLTEVSVKVSFTFNWHVPNLELQPNSISSDPFQVCLCKDGGVNCNTSELDRQMQVYPGQLLKLPMVATGQRNGIVPAVIQAFFNGTQKNASLAPLQDTQDVNNCTELFYQVRSSASNISDTLVLYADGPCSTNGQLLDIPLEFLDCPHGFSLNPSEGICECEPRLQEYTTRCNITELSLERSGDFWVGYDNHTKGLILHPHCPFDYCISTHINFTLNDTDKQCEHSRSGLLCGECKSGFSLALGSSKCLQCCNTYILLLIPFALAGIALVLLLFICKLTVVAGTINGLILYANIVAVNRSIFFPPNETNILTVFIAWLNLDLGIETCFFDGLDAYGKTWLQFVFPLYVWSLVGLIIIASKYSPKITRLFGSNPVAVLATLFFLSYAKLLRTILAVLYFTFLDYPDEVRVAVWLYDGNITYIYSKHVALFIVALLTFLVIFLPYTFFLTFGQWVQAMSDRRFFSWINKPRIKPFLDAYHAPYRDQHRYWIGLLLCLRCILFTVFGLVSLLSIDPSHNLLAIEAVVIGLVTLTRFTGVIYKKLYLDVLEASFILNLGILAAVTYSVRHAELPESQAAVTYTSVGVAFATFVGILVYHTYQHIWPKLQPKIYKLLHCRERRSESFDEADVDNRAHISTAPTMTVVERPSPESPEINAELLVAPKSFIELREPFISTDSNQL